MFRPVCSAINYLNQGIWILRSKMQGSCRTLKRGFGLSVCLRHLSCGLGTTYERQKVPFLPPPRAQVRVHCPASKLCRLSDESFGYLVTWRWLVLDTFPYWLAGFSQIAGTNARFNAAGYRAMSYDPTICSAGSHGWVPACDSILPSLDLGFSVFPGLSIVHFQHSWRKRMSRLRPATFIYTFTHHYSGARRWHTCLVVSRWKTKGQWRGSKSSPKRFWPRWTS